MWNEWTFSNLSAIRPILLKCKIWGFHGGDYEEFMRRLLVTANVVPSSPILVTLMMEGLPSSETSVLTTTTEPNIPDEAVLQFYQKESKRVYKTQDM
jgi:hypothetical protein